MYIFPILLSILCFPLLLEGYTCCYDPELPWAKRLAFPIFLFKALY